MYKPLAATSHEMEEVLSPASHVALVRKSTRRGTCNGPL